ncbi:MAG: hypothetical protein WCJ33_09675, partial [Pseudomonadota bacterium]
MNNNPNDYEIIILTNEVALYPDGTLIPVATNIIEKKLNKYHLREAIIIFPGEKLPSVQDLNYLTKQTTRQQII